MTDLAGSFLAPLALEADAAGSHQLVEASTDTVLATRLEPAFSLQDRKRGLLGRRMFEAGSAIMLAPCGSIHTFFMKFSIDVIFALRDGRILAIYHELKPWRLAATLRGFAAIELPAGTLDRTAVAAWTRLTVVPAHHVRAEKT